MISPIVIGNEKKEEVYPALYNDSTRKVGALPGEINYLRYSQEVQKRWEEHKVFEVDAGSKPPKEGEKFFGNFPYPYMNGLLHLGYTIYSPLDVQPCADHDRASGEGVQPQGCVLIKMEVLPPFTPKMKVLEGRKVYLAAATLRPETMYGQTNAWVLPDGKYGAFEINETDVFIITHQAALNLAYQKLSLSPEKPTNSLELSGHDLIGLPLRSPLAFNEIIYSLPVLTILTDKGTGNVTSVPRDSPDDFVALQDLKSKPALRSKFGVKDGGYFL
ncbi:leucyl-tRNA synthetase [Musa troglodytarum]|uniref:Leucyl-tRNA synthetase n=1 Tax=Musa troglodytarum TaxID=320322 RepID=A0A9E7JKC8_9LILI|nr:leucyl-tRNA synthetase [Musa troglodytarum]